MYSKYSLLLTNHPRIDERLTNPRRGCAAFIGRDINKLKAKGAGGGKLKYLPEKEMLELAAKFAPYR